MMTFDKWFAHLDVFEVDPYTEIDNKYDIEAFLREAFNTGSVSGMYDMLEFLENKENDQ